MATINPTVERISNSAVVLKWTPVTEADTCVAAPTEFGEYADRSVQVTGAFGGGTVQLHGSNDGSAFSALTDPTQSTITISAAGIKQVLEQVRSIKPVLVGGTSASVTITVFARRGRGGKEV